MSDEELVKRLRASRAVWENGRSHPTDDEAEAADRIEALTEQLEQLVAINEAARGDAKEAEAYAEELEAKLAKAVEGLREIRGNGDATGRNPQLMANIARATLAEIEGEKG
jgi:cysteine sulfinate desulfinase/cysteine desulfurase-like protein